MIPRFKPYLDQHELLALFSKLPDAVSQFEREFADMAGTRFALAFPYGRSAIWAFLKAMGIEGAEVIQPAYTCVVVAHATVLSGNIPRFVDISLDDYNMDLDQVERVINENTHMVIATHLFGYPLDVNRLVQIVQAAEERYGHKIWIMQDCAHSFGARWQGRLVSAERDIAVFGLNISKIATSVFGGMLTTNDFDLMERIRVWRDTHFIFRGVYKTLRRVFYLLATYLAFNESVYGLVNWLQEETSLLNYFTRAYHLDELIHFPPDYRDQMLSVEAKVGLAQLAKYADNIRRRQENAAYYKIALQALPEIVLPPLVNGASYSHYVIRVEERQQFVDALRKKGVQLGLLIDYSVPHMNAYKNFANSEEFPNSKYCSEHMINLPIFPDLSFQQRDYIIECLKSIS